VYLTLKQCADLAKIGVSSARFYKDKPEFKHYFTTIGEGRNTKYQEGSTIELLTLISKSYADNLDADQIVEILESSYGVVTDLVTQEKKNNSTTEQQEDLTHSIRAIFSEELGKRDQLILDLQEQLSDNQQELTDIKQSLESLHEKSENRDRTSLRRHEDITLMMKNLMAEKERIQQQRKWWHIFSGK